MRYAIIIIDGAADRPCAELNGLTPLQAARMPALDRLTLEGRLLLAKTIPDGFVPGSDVACLSVLGFDPKICYTGRAPLEAAAMGIELKEDQVVYRANTVTINNGIMDDYSAGHISTEEAASLINFLKPEIDTEKISLHAGVQYRHACILSNATGKEAETTPPHDIIDKAIAGYLPQGELGSRLIEIMKKTKKNLPDCPINQKRKTEGKKAVTQLWLWGGGTMPKLKSYQEEFGLSGGLISAVDLLKGIATLSGLEVINVPGATGYYDTNYQGKAEAAIQCLKHSDLITVHIEAPDEAGHSGCHQEKITALENIDKFITTTISNYALEQNNIRILVMPDHPTPLLLQTHSSEPVPACIWGPGISPSGATSFSEENAAKSHIVLPGNLLLRELINCGRSDSCA